MQWGLFLLLLVGQCSVSTCHRYEYHFINESKTWKDAQSYCREKYTDLATVYDMSDMKRLQDSAGSSAEGWIGLYSKGGHKMKWRWSQPGEVYSEHTTKWKPGEQNNNGGHQDCVQLDNNRKWKAVGCHQKMRFICYNESSSEKIHRSDGAKTWTEAQSYCREHHTDLVSGDQLKHVKTGGVNESDITWWIGLFKDAWAWSDGSNSSFRHWESFQSGRMQKRCAYLKKSEKWDNDSCSETRFFFCYEENMILIQQNLTWDQAVDYCRENHSELVSITSEEQKRMAEQIAKKATTPYVWLGLRYSCALHLWFWVNDNIVCDDDWEVGKDPDCSHCVAMESGGDHEWSKRDETDLYNFICVKKKV